jgi:hypothetical protein
MVGAGTERSESKRISTALDPPVVRAGRGTLMVSPLMSYWRATRVESTRMES